MVICVYYENEVHIVWDKITEVDGYKLYQQTSDNLYTSFKDVTDNQVLLFGMTDNKLKIKPYKRVDNEFKYDFGQYKFTLGEEELVEEFVTITKTQNATTNLLWKKIKGADSYKLYLNNEFVVETNLNEYYFKLLNYGESDLKIEAYQGDSLIKTSAPIKVNTLNMELHAINTDGKILLYWNRVPNVSGYRLFKRNGKGEFEAFQTSLTTNVLVDNIVAGEFAEYKVKPYVLKDNKREYSGLQAKCKVNVYNSSHIDLRINKAYGNQLSISWLFEGDVDGFELYRNNGLINVINDGLAHILMIDNEEGCYQLKGYKNYFSEKLYTSQSEVVNNLTHKLSLPTPQNYKLSVIIPAYNSQDYIPRTIATVLSSTLNDIELVIVDDGSSDNTREVLSWYTEKYPKYVKAIFKENGGVAHTRNVGIEYAHGEYIAFMDNDDMIRPDGFKKLYDAISMTKSDIAVAPLYRIDNDKYVVRHRLPFACNVSHDIENYLKLVFSDGYNNIGVWNKLYKANLVKEHPFGLLAYEDVSWTPYILSYADNFCYVNDICYEWDRKIRPATFSNVLSNRSAEEKFKERFEAFEFFYKQGNQKRKECLAYIKAKRLFGQGTTAKYHKYFDAIKEMKAELINNKFLLEDEKAKAKILPLLID